MSTRWVRANATTEGLDDRAVDALREVACRRRVLLVTFESDGALAHAQAWADIHGGKSDRETHAHIEHGITKEWNESNIDAVVNARVRARERKKMPETKEPAEKSERPNKTKNTSRKPRS